MQLTIARIAEALGVEPMGDASLTVAGIAEPGLAGRGDLALAMSPKFAEAISAGKARAALVWPGADWQAMGLAAAIPVGRPRLAMADLTRAFDAGPGWSDGIHPSAVIEDGAVLGEGVSVGAFTYVGRGARVGAGSRIGPQVSVGAGVQIGDAALLHPGVRIGGRAVIGRNFIANPNSVIGSDGFSFVTEEVSMVENARHTLGVTGDARPQEWQRIHSLGGVVIGDDVEIGSNSAIDQGTVRPTRVGDGTKIDNLVQIGHNCLIGKHNLICGGVGIAGSTRIGDYCVLGGQVGIGDNLKIGDRVICAGGSKVMFNVASGRVVQGYPAVDIAINVANYKALRRLPRILERLREAQKGVPNADESD